MPHLVILYTANLEPETDMTALCRGLADTMLEVQDESGAQVFPTGGTRVLAYPAPHFAVADGQADYAFVYLNLRMGKGRTDATKKRAGDALLMRAKAHFQPIFMQRHIGMTLQIDEGHEVFDAKHSNLHPLFQK
jgi:5-carboxymethyl-2-hydroxymuconate isomerase